MAASPRRNMTRATRTVIALLVIAAGASPAGSRNALASGALTPGALTPGALTPAAPVFTPGAPGAGDPYYPLDGNGGYDVQHYRLELRYEPGTDHLGGRATITASATQDLSSFNLDLLGLDVTAVAIDGSSADWSRAGGELTITPGRGLPRGKCFVVVIDYGGVPQPLTEFGVSGFIHTAEGALVAGEPHVASSWFPVNDHPSDRATYTFEITVPEGVEAVANGVLSERRSSGGNDTWVWEARSPMASYLAGLAIGQLSVSSREQDGIAYWDAVDASLFEPFVTPTSGERFVGTQPADLSYKRLTRTITVPPEGASLSFSVTRDTEPTWDFFFVEAHGVGTDDWTTLPDQGGIATQDTGSSCPFWHAIHPFLAHYQTAPASDLEPCAPSGTSGAWWAASGPSDGAERWSVDLSEWAGADVEVALAYASDDSVQLRGVFVDDIVVSTGAGSTSFEDDGDPLDGWAVAGAPEGSPGNANDWQVETTADAPAPPGVVASASLAREPEILAFLADNFGPYPFDAAGALVVDFPLGFALELQTRPIYPGAFFNDGVSGADILVHELAHQWFGDSLTVQAWQHIWLNEGFATYAEWLWAEHEGLGTAEAAFDAAYELDAEDPLWSIAIGDPGPEAVFDYAVYLRGAMTLQQLRVTVGDEPFFDILQTWASAYAGDTVSSDDFIALAECLSGRDLGALFDAWLFTPSKPALEVAPVVSATPLRSAFAASIVASSARSRVVKAAPPALRRRIEAR
jgi:peptidase M1-like protein